MIFIVLALLTGTAAPPGSSRFWLAMVWLIVPATFGGYGLYWMLIARLGVTPVNTLLFLVPPVTTVWGALMFGEPLTALTVLGLALALVATWLAARGRTGDSARGG